MASDNVWAEVKSRLNVMTAASQLNLKPKGKKFDCPACGGDGKAMSNDGIGWYCVKCEEKGDGIDLFRICLSISSKDALKQAAFSIGIDVDAGNTQHHQPRPTPVKPEPWKLHPIDVGERFAALTVAAAHYERLRLEHHDYLHSLVGVNTERDEALSACLEYLHVRRAMPDQKLPVPVGICPWWKTGLIEVLDAAGGDDMVQAGYRAGLITPKKGDGDDHFEYFRGRAIFPWTDPESGQVVYIKGRAVPEIADKTHTKKIPHLGLRTNPNDPRKQPHVPRPLHPFGATWANELFTGQPVIIQEAEIDAISAMMARVPAVAIGGTAGVGGEAVGAWLAGRPAVVIWDNDWQKAMAQARAGRPKKTWATEVAIRTARRLAIDLDCDWNLVRRMDRAKDLNQVLIDRGVTGVSEEVGWSVTNAVGVNDSIPGHLVIVPSGHDEPQQEDLDLVKLVPSLDDLSRRDVPNGWSLRQGVLHKRKWDKGNNTHINEPVGIDRTPLVTGHVIDVHSEAWHVELETEMIGGGMKKILARRSVVATKKGIVGLADDGLDVTGESATWMVKWIDAYQRHNKTIPIVHGSEQFGWHGDRDGDDLTFLLGDRSIGPMDIRYTGGESKLVQSVKPRGSISNWRGVPKILEKYPRGLVVLYAALASPGIFFIDEMSGFCVEVCGSSSSGKSTSSQAAASIIASPSRGYLRSGAAGDSVPGLEHTMAASSDCPVFVEDTHKYPPEMQARLAMMAANGEGKARSNQAGTKRLPTKQWRTVSVFTTESPVSATTSFVGDQARTITLRPPMEGVDAETDISMLQRLSARNHGHAFLQWVTHLQSGGWVQLMHAYDAWHQHMRDVASSDSVQRRWAKPWALIAAVADCAAPVLGLPGTHSRIISEQCEKWFDGRETPSQARTAVNTILEWAATRVDEVVNDESVQGHKGQKLIWIRILGEESAARMKVPEGTVCYAAQELKKRMKRDVQTSLDVVLPVWKKEGWAGDNRQVRIGKGRPRCVLIYPDKLGMSFKRHDLEEKAFWHGNRDQEGI